MGARVWRKRRGLVEALKTVGTLVAVLGVITLGLRILDLIPPYLAPEAVRTYPTVEEAQRSTGLPIYLPAYFPDYLKWPPDEIRGWPEPDRRVSIKVALRDSGQAVLWLEEWLPRAGEPLPDMPKTAQVVERETFDLGNGLEAEMVSYTDIGAQLYYRLLWDQADVRVVLTATLPRDEVVRMARSMYPPPSY